MLRLEDSVVEGLNFCLVHWMLPETAPPEDVGHPAHMHKHGEVLFHIGTDPNDPKELGAEIEFYMGKELERHVIKNTTAVFLPPNFVHGPWKVVKTVKPWIFIELHQGPHTEKLVPEVLPKEIKEKVDWDKWKFIEKGF
jgi:hypothetical protein